MSRILFEFLGSEIAETEGTATGTTTLEFVSFSVVVAGTDGASVGSTTLEFVGEAVDVETGPTTVGRGAGLHIKLSGKYRGR